MKTLLSNDFIVIDVKGGEIFIEKTNEFIKLNDTKLTLEHSLVSISKWESKWHKPFLGNEDKTAEELLSYIQCMTIEEVDPLIYSFLTPQNIEEIKQYISDPMTATTFREIEGSAKGNSRQIITSELIYYSIVALQIPIECQHWHLSRLTTLIRVCNEKNSPEKKMSKNTILKNNAALNAARRKRLNSQG